MKSSLGSDKDKQACASKSTSRCWEYRVTSRVPILPSPRLRASWLTAELGICQRSSSWILYLAKEVWGSAQPRGNSSAMRPWKSVFPLLFQGWAYELCCFLYDLGRLFWKMPSEVCTTSDHHHRWPLGNLAYLAMHYQVRTTLTVPVIPAGRSKRFSFFRFSSKCKLW